jgi:hypothetical protein
MAKPIFKRTVLSVEPLEDRQLLSGTSFHLLAAPLLLDGRHHHPKAAAAWVYHPGTGSWSDLVTGPGGSTLTIVAKNGDITQTVVLFDAGDGDNTITTDTTWHKASGLVTRKTTDVDGDCDEPTLTRTEAWKPLRNAFKSGWQYSLNGGPFTDISSDPPPPAPPSTGGH